MNKSTSIENPNIILIGMPGSGKSTIGEHLHKITHLPLLDIDEHIERHERKSVAKIIQKIGDEAFLNLEAKLVQEINPQGMIISCSGSVPLRQEAMNHLRKTGTSIYIDVPIAIIASRLHRMKVDRIIGMNGRPPEALEEVLTDRLPFYNRSYDYDFICPDDVSKDEKVQRFVDFMKTTNPNLLPNIK
ncbi:MAG: shikimate kinase [Candidatus Gracilibacteria bacterium]|nr:shikimate kinase [Candidatus Gracilibacteria bacterium]